MYLTEMHTKIWLKNLKGGDGRPRHRWKDNIRIDLMEIEWEGMNWIQLAQDKDQWLAFVNMVINLSVS
jgi:hypothetical protein